MEPVVTMDGAEPKRKRHVIVVKKIEQKSPKKPVYVSRKVRDVNELAEMEESMLGATAPQHPVHDKDGTILPRSILGDPKYFDMIENAPEGDATALKPASPPKSTMSRASSRRSMMSTGSLLSRKSRTPKEPTVVDPSVNPDLYISTLETMKLKAAKARVKEQEKEATIVNFLPVNERFNLNKEGKVLTRWQERQKQWDGIQNRLASRLGGTKDSLLMSTLDEYRGRNEEYDILQAAIPPHERFGAHSWQMMLRGGGERSVAVGHIFSGLTCNIAIKERIPPMLRKPRPVGAAPARDTFVDPTPSLLAKRKHLNKTLTAIRPHSIGPNLVEGLVVSGTDLFDWAIESSKEFVSRAPAANAAIAATPTTAATVKNTHFNAGFHADSPGSDSPLAKGGFVDGGPKLSYLSVRNVVFNNLVGDVTHQVLSFKNTGTAALNFSWREIPDRSSNPISAVLNEHTELPREHDLCKARPHFYCQKPKGYILPGEVVDTVFSFSSKGCGGYFSQNWLLDTVPKATISFPNQHPVTATSASKTSPRAASAGPSNVMHTSVSIKLRGFAATMDNMQHRRTAICASLDTAAINTSTADEIYACMRRVRQPITVNILNNRKINLFKNINIDVLQRFFSQFVDLNEVHVSIDRLTSLVNLANCVAEFCTDMNFKHEVVQQRALELQCAEQEVHFDMSPEEMEIRRIKKSAIRQQLLPEKTLESFDGIDASMLDIGWDMDVNLLFGDLDAACEVCKTIAANEAHIEEVLKQRNKEHAKAEKAAQRAARRGQDSDEEEDDDEEEDEVEEEEEPEISTLETIIHADTITCTNLILSLRNALFELVLPIAETSLFTDIPSKLSDAFDSADDFAAKLRHELQIPAGIALGPVPSAYCDDVGEELWREVLSAPAVDAGKKAPPAKAKGEGVTDEQRKKYIGQLYNEFYKNILTSMEHVLVCADEELQATALKTEKYSDADQLACVRTEDVAQTSTVFMSIDADSFSVSAHPSAYDAKSVAQIKIALQIWTLAERGVKRVVMLCESESDVFGDTLDASVAEVVSAIDKYKATLPEKVQRMSVASKYSFSCIGCVNIAELQLDLRDTPTDECTIQLFLVNNLQADGVVPADLPFEEPVSDDEEGPITIGLEEKKALDVEKWRGAVTRKREVHVRSGAEMVSVDVSDALSELIAATGAIWIENSASSLCNPLRNKHLHRVAAANRLLSLDLRETVVWSSVLKHAAAPEFTVGERTDIASVTSLADYFTFLYPSIATSSSPELRSHAVIGGSLSIEKIRLLDALCDVAGTIIVAGEVSLPFMACTRRIVFPAHEVMYRPFMQSCSSLLKKCKCRGVRLILPVDVSVGDEVVTADLKNKPSVAYDKDARDEGADYDGESKLLMLPDGTTDDVEKWPRIPGYVLDIGPETCSMLRAEIATSDLLLAWGPVGCCEVSSFQTGQRTLVTAILQRNGITPDTKPSTKALHCVVLGDASVEWWARFSDPEGEVSGDLVNIGVASYASRVSSGIVGMLSNLPSATIAKVQRRPPAAEWIFDALHPREIDEDEDDEEEEND